MSRFLNIEGSEKVLETFGEWPSFHDAEVLSVNLNRGKVEGKYGPSVTIVIHGFTITSDLNEKNHFRTINHAQIEFLFLDVAEFSLTHGFGTQNPLSGVHINDIRSHGLENIHYEVGFDAHFNCDIEFKCSRIIIKSIKEGMPSGSIHK